jgi:hypothetical protein
VNAAREAEAFCAMWGIPTDRVLLDEGGSYARELRIPGVPTNVLVDARGIVRAVGVSAPGELYAAVDEMLASPRGRDAGAR